MLACRTGNAELATQSLTPLPNDFEPDWNDEVEIIPASQYWLATNVPYFAGSGECNRWIVINCEQAIGLSTTKFPEGSSGGCGNSSHLRNQVCDKCGTAVGIRIDDRWTSYYTYFPTDAAAIKQ